MINCSFENGKIAQLRHVTVHAIVEKNGTILLGKRHPTFLEGGKWGLPGGYVDRDETVEQAAIRELLEETGWQGKVTGLLRVNSNPQRPGEDRQNISFDFIVTPLQKVQDPDWESTAVEWVPIDEHFAFDTLAFDHGETIQLYLQWKKEQFVIPIVK